MKKYRVELYCPYRGLVIRNDVIEADSYQHANTGIQAWSFIFKGRVIASYPVQYTIITEVE